jgi:hypothetical protein
VGADGAGALAWAMAAVAAATAAAMAALWTLLWLVFAPRVLAALATFAASIKAWRGSILLGALYHAGAYPSLPPPRAQQLSRWWGPMWQLLQLPAPPLFPAWAASAYATPVAVTEAL